MISESLIKNYLTHLEDVLTQHVQAKSLSFSKASRHYNDLANSLFGTQEYKGIVQYLLERKELNLTPEEAISRAEGMVEKGWYIAPSNGRYVLFNNEFKEAADLTGPRQTNDDWEMTPENAFLMLSGSDFSTLENLCNNPELAKSPQYALNIVQNQVHETDPLYWATLSYSHLNVILSRNLAFTSIGQADEIKNIYTLGYRIAHVENPTSKVFCFLEGQGKTLRVRPAAPGDDIVLALKQTEKEILTGIDVEIPFEIAELGQTYALAFEYDEHNQDFGEIIQIFTDMRPVTAKRMLTSICDVIVEQSFLGNKSFTLADLSISPVNAKIKLKYRSRLERVTGEEVKKLFTSYQSYPANDITLDDLRAMSFDFSQEHIVNFNSIVSKCSPGLLGKLKRLNK